MPRFSRLRVAAILVMLIPLIFVPARLPAQQPPEKPGRADRNIEALGYLEQADRELACSPEKAIAWAQKALDTLASGSDNGRSVEPGVANARSQCSAKIAVASRRIADLASVATAAAASLKGARLEAGMAKITEADPDACYTGFNSVRFRLDQRRAAADSLVRQGDLAAKFRRGRARSYYFRAREINAEYPGLQGKIDALSRP